MVFIQIIVILVIKFTIFIIWKRRSSNVCVSYRKPWRVFTTEWVQQITMTYIHICYIITISIDYWTPRLHNISLSSFVPKHWSLGVGCISRRFAYDLVHRHIIIISNTVCCVPSENKNSIVQNQIFKYVSKIVNINKVWTF